MDKRPIVLGPLPEQSAGQVDGVEAHDAHPGDRSTYCAPGRQHLALQVGQRPAGRRARGRQPLQKMWPQVEETTRRPGPWCCTLHSMDSTSGQDGGESGEADGAVEVAEGAGVPGLLRVTLGTPAERQGVNM